MNTLKRLKAIVSLIPKKEHNQTILIEAIESDIFIYIRDTETTNFKFKFPNSAAQDFPKTGIQIKRIAAILPNLPEELQFSLDENLLDINGNKIPVYQSYVYDYDVGESETVAENVSMDIFKFSVWATIGIKTLKLQFAKVVHIDNAIYATNGHMLAKVIPPFQSDQVFEIPHISIQSLLKFAKHCNKIEFFSERNAVKISCNDVELSYMASTLEDQHLSYESVFPENVDKTFLLLNVSQLVKELKKIKKYIYKEKEKDIGIQLKVNDKFLISTKSGKTFDLTDKILWQGSINTYFDIKYLIEILSFAKINKVTMSHNSTIDGCPYLFKYPEYDNVMALLKPRQQC